MSNGSLNIEIKETCRCGATNNANMCEIGQFCKIDGICDNHSPCFGDDHNPLMTQCNCGNVGLCDPGEYCWENLSCNPYERFGKQYLFMFFISFVPAVFNFIQNNLKNI